MPLDARGRPDIVGSLRPLDRTQGEDLSSSSRLDELCANCCIIGVNRRLSLRSLYPLAAALVAFIAYTQPTFARPNPRTHDIQQRSAELSRSYLHSWSSAKGATAAEVRRVYAPRVRFYGRLITHRELTREKARFAHRWPVRRYSHRPGTMRVSCYVTRQTCMVRSLIDWRTANPHRQATSGGVSRFEQAIRFSARNRRALVISENGSVIRRTKPHRG